MRHHYWVIGLLSLGCAEDSASWTYDSDDLDESDVEGEGEDEGEEWEEDDWEEDDWEDEIIFERVIWGYVEGAEGWTGLYSADPDQGGVLCDVIYDLDDWSPTEACSDCIEAWIFTRGAEYVETNQDEACEAEGWLGLDGTTLGVGYDEESLIVDLGDGWQAWEEGDGEIGDDYMFFEFALER